MKNQFNTVFSGRKLLLALPAEEQEILRTLLEQNLGVQVISNEFFGFAADIHSHDDHLREASTSAINTARALCEQAYHTTGSPLVLAGHSCFGAHPSIKYLPANEQVLVLKDFEEGREYVARVVSTQTNFAGNEYFEIEDANYFAVQANFPSHALTVRKAKDDFSEVHKDLNTWPDLKQSLRYFMNTFGKAYVETDLRAHMNPSRAKVIREAAAKLIAAIGETVPERELTASAH